MVFFESVKFRPSTFARLTISILELMNNTTPLNAAITLSVAADLQREDGVALVGPVKDTAILGRATIELASIRVTGERKGDNIAQVASDYSPAELANFKVFVGPYHCPFSTSRLCVMAILGQNDRH